MLEIYLVIHLFLFFSTTTLSFLEFFVAERKENAKALFTVGFLGPVVGLLYYGYVLFFKK